MKIKCLLAALAVSALMYVPAQAQDELETRHEVSISYGVCPNSTWIDIFESLIPAIAGAKIDGSNYLGPIGLEYHYRVNPLIGVGAIGVYSGFNQTIKDSNTTKSKNSYFTLMPSVKFNWLRRSKWGMYSKLAAGASLRHASLDVQNATEKAKSENDVFFNFHVSLLGVEVGSEQVLGFVEAGLGEQGILLAGMRYKF